jgi:hypothetical protein
VIKHALLAGREDIVDLLVQHGATWPALSDGERFIAAVAVGDVVTMRQLAVTHPNFLKSHHAMFAAITRNNPGVVGALLRFGMSPDVGDEKNFRALHCAAQCGAVEAAKLLIAHDAEIDPFEQRYGGTPLTHACYHQQREMIDLLVPSPPYAQMFQWLCATPRRQLADIFSGARRG